MGISAPQVVACIELLAIVEFVLHACACTDVSNDTTERIVMRLLYL